MQRWLADPDHRSDRYGRYHYAPEPFERIPKRLREKFAFYCDRFNLQ